MSTSRFEGVREDPIFKSERPLRESHDPDSLEERDKELDDYAAALTPILKGDPPQNIFVVGEPGIGKTVATEFIVRDLQSSADNYDDIDLTVVWLSCRSLTTSYQVASELRNKMRVLNGKEEAAGDGINQNRMLKEMFKEMRDLGGTVLIILDEIDNINDEDILFELPRASASNDWNLSGVEPGIIGISNDFQFQDNLSPAVKDSLCKETLTFSPYTATQLRSILSRRADKAFHDGVIGQGVIEKCAALAGNDTGSARQALQLLHRSGAIARENDAESVSRTHVELAESRLMQEDLYDAIRDFTTQQHLVLGAVTTLEADGDTPARTRTIYDRYQGLVAKHDAKEVSRRRMQSPHLETLQHTQIVTQSVLNDGPNTGRVYQYELDADIEVVLEALAKETCLGETAKQYQEQREQSDQSSMQIQF